MARRQEPVAIRSVIPRVIEQLSRRGPDARDRLAEAWPRAVGKAAAPHTRLVSLQQGTVTVLVDDSTRLFSLHAQEAAILRRLQRLLAQRPAVAAAPAVERLQFRLGSLS